jgi:hypothetical protein
MKITIEVEAPDFHTVPGLAAQVAPEVARLVSQQVHGTAVVVVSATEEDSESDYAVVEDNVHTDKAPDFHPYALGWYGQF